ncbi:MAG: hypothetical protein V4472_21715 [Pseudomonadota bacterium]
MKLAALTAAIVMMTAAPALAQTSAAAAAPAADAATTARFTLDTPIEAIAADPAGKAVLNADFPEMLAHPAYEQFKGMSLAALQPMANGQITDEQLAKAKADLAAIK